MDMNKRQELLNIEYSIQGNCSNCEHGRFDHKAAFGVCSLHSYQHLKHTGDKRQLSVYAHGRCPKFELEDGKKAQLGLWQEFLQ